MVMPATKAWKRTEAEVAKLFHGKRTPLSGSNSGHGTTGDVIHIPSWLYIEVKRDKKYNQFFEDHFPWLRRGITLVVDWHGVLIYVFRLDRFMQSHAATITNDKRVKVRDNSAPFVLYDKTWQSALKEQRDTAVQVHRIHGKHGLYCLVNEHSLRRVQKWVSIWGKPVMKAKRDRIKKVEESEIRSKLIPENPRDGDDEVGGYFL